MYGSFFTPWIPLKHYISVCSEIKDYSISHSINKFHHSNTLTEKYCEMRISDLLEVNEHRQAEHEEEYF